MRGRRPLPRYFWRTLALVGGVAEGYAVVRSTEEEGLKPLTHEVRGRLMGTAAGSAVVCAGLGWLLWHWGMDREGLDAADVAAALGGAAVGVAGWRLRRTS